MSLFASSILLSEINECTSARVEVDVILGDNMITFGLHISNYVADVKFVSMMHVEYSIIIIGKGTACEQVKATLASNTCKCFNEGVMGESEEL